MFVDRKTQSGNNRLGQLFQARSFKGSVCQDRPYIGRPTQTVGFQETPQQVEAMGKRKILQIGRYKTLGVQRRMGDGRKQEDLYSQEIGGHSHCKVCEN
jgi:hypothetical protein